MFGDDDLLKGYERLWQGFLSYHNAEEGWSREYDGIDPGYLSATVSFLSKIYIDKRDDLELEKVIKQSIEMCSFFAYPNGFYAGSLGSRNTLHFYPHGFEIMASEDSLAAAVAEKMLHGLSQGKLVPPEIISDRYVFYRVPEFLQSYLDYGSRPETLPELPGDRVEFFRYFPSAGIAATTQNNQYTIANLAKGGVVKIFDTQMEKLIFNDCGLIAQLNDGRVLTTQWIDPNNSLRVGDGIWEVSGTMNFVPSNKLFSLIKNLIFRSTLLLLGWNARFSHLLKGYIRKTLILGQRNAPVSFRRLIRMENGSLEIIDEVEIRGDISFKSFAIGDEFFVRYVPQSRYFQSQELDVSGEFLNVDELNSLNSTKKMAMKRLVQRDGSVHRQPV